MKKIKKIKKSQLDKCRCGVERDEFNNYRGDVRIIRGVECWICPGCLD